MKTLAEIQDDATELRALADHFSHQRDVNFVVECADSLQALAQARDTAQAEAKAAQEKVERLHERLDFLHDLINLPRLQGGVLSIGYDLDPQSVWGEGKTTYVMRQEWRGKVRQAEAIKPEDAFRLLTAQPYSDRVLVPDDALEALKVPMTNEVQP